MLAEGKQKYLWMINLSGALLNVIGNLICIPLIGAAGAAIVSVLTQFFTNVVLCVIMKPIRPVCMLFLRALHPKLLLETLSVIKNKNHR